MGSGQRTMDIGMWTENSGRRMMDDGGHKTTVNSVDRRHDTNKCGLTVEYLYDVDGIWRADSGHDSIRWTAYVAMLRYTLPAIRCSQTCRCQRSPIGGCCLLYRTMLLCRPAGAVARCGFLRGRTAVATHLWPYDEREGELSWVSRSGLAALGAAVHCRLAAVRR